MDNRIFNVNGKGAEALRSTLQLVFNQEGEKTTCKAWKFSQKHGLVLFWWAEEGNGRNKLPSELTAEECLPMVWAWLHGEEAKTVELTGWDKAVDHDGDNGEGWRVYCEDWGHVAGEHSAICAVKPVVLWYGK